MVNESSKQAKAGLSTNTILVFGVSIVVMGLLFMGMTWTGHDVSIEERQYLGPASNPEGLIQAEAGVLGQPALVFFHADWCHVCEQVRPDVVQLGQQFEGQIEIIRLNVDHPQNREAMARYGVRATPTFVILGNQGELEATVPGWPGYQALVDAFNTLLTIS